MIKESKGAAVQRDALTCGVGVAAQHSETTPQPHTFQRLIDQYRAEALELTGAARVAAYALVAHYRARALGWGAANA